MMIKFLAFYGDTEKKQNRMASLAAENKINYVCSALSELGYDNEIISAGITRDKKSYKGSVEKLNERTVLRLPHTFPWGNKLQKLFSLISLHLFLLYHLIFRTGNSDTVFVYHSLEYRTDIKIARFLKRFRVIFDVEEIYSDLPRLKKYKKIELPHLQMADGYIFPTVLLNRIVNTDDKPFVIGHGTYREEAVRFKKAPSGTIHCVYSGTFDPEKGAEAAISAAEYLPQEYHIHIIGFGTREQTENIQKKIRLISEKSVAKITYDGLKIGEDYIRFLQDCDIGLCTQNPQASFSDTSFPSKTLAYLANGLRVVSVRIPAIETSDIGQAMFYYGRQTPEEIARTIQSIDINAEYDSRALIRDLHRKFVKELDSLLKESAGE